MISTILSVLCCASFVVCESICDPSSGLKCAVVSRPRVPAVRRSFSRGVRQSLSRPVTMPSPMKKVCKYDKDNDDDNVLRFAKLSEHAHAPTKGSALAAGFDLKSAYPYVVKAHGKELIKTDIQIKVPHGTYGRIAPRSGLAWKNFIDVGAGVIDEDYRGNVGIILFNHSDQDFVVNSGDRVAQLICEKIAYPEISEFESLDETVRGTGGFGSTGTN